MTPVLQARRERVNRIRRRVAGSAAGLFLISTGAIVVQMVTGHDPALARAGSTRLRPAAAAPRAAATVDPQSGGQSSGPAGGGDRPPGSVSGGPPSSGQVTPMTTGQS
jgi:hypothetical protein